MRLLALKSYNTKWPRLLLREFEGSVTVTTNYDIKKIFDVVLAFNSELRYEDMLNIILSKMMEITNSDAGTLYIVDEGKLHFRIVKNKTLGIHQSADDNIDLPPVQLDKNNIENISAYTALNNEIVVIEDVYESERFNFTGPKNYDKITGYRTQSMMVLPLATYWNKNVEVLGVIQLINATDPIAKKVVPYGNVFSPPIIPALANVAANTLTNLIHIREIRMLFKSFVSAMVHAIDERSKYNSNHTQKVTRLCEIFARHLNKKFPPGHPFNFDDVHLEELTMSAMLHDIVKIVTPVSIMDKADRLGERLDLVRSRFEIKKNQIEIDMLKGHITNEAYLIEIERLTSALKLVETVAITEFLTEDMAYEVQKLAGLTYKNPNGKDVPLLEPIDIECLSIRRGTLTNKERGIMQEHVSVTNRILHNIAFKKYYKNVPKWARSHHEFLDGSGYPLGLKGPELAPEACIITIMDIFEALTASDRPYKKAMPVEKALGILIEMANAGKLHQELVQLFIDSQVWQEVL